jgi:RNA-binding protein YlmH
MNSDNLDFAKVLDKMSAAQKKGCAFTDFLDAASCEKFILQLKKILPNEISAIAFGGFENAERKMIGFYLDEVVFPIAAITFTYNEKFSKPLSHRDYLGATLGLGIDRAKIGDIRIAENGAVIYVSTDVAEFIRENLQQVKRTAVKGEIGETLTFSENAGNEKRITVPSLRLDAVVSSAFNLSRGKSAALIEGEKVFINWKLAKKTQSVNPGDTITIRGVGRAVVHEQLGNTKKDRIVLRITVNI